MIFLKEPAVSRALLLNIQLLGPADVHVVRYDYLANGDRTSLYISRNLDLVRYPASVWLWFLPLI